MDVKSPLMELGVDSLVAVGARVWFTKELGIDIPVLKFLGGASVVSLVEDAMAKLPADLLPSVRSDVQDSKPDDLSAASTLPIALPEPVPGSTETSTPVELNLDQSTPGTTQSTPSASCEIDLLETSITSHSDKESRVKSFKPALVRTAKLSYSQSRFWFLKHSLEDQTVLNITFSHQLKGKRNAQQLSTAVRKIGEIHEGLRTCYFVQDNQPMQGVLLSSPLEMEIRSIASVEEARQEFQRLDKHVYDLESGHTMKIVLLELSPSSAYLIVGYHHIAMDGAGFTGLLSELWSVFGATPITPPTRQYIYYSQKEQDDVDSGAMANELRFWKKEFANLPPLLPLLPFSKVKSRSPLKTYSFSSASCRIDSVLAARIKRRCRNFQATAFHFHLAVLNTVLFRLLVIDDMCIGIADSNRSEDEMQRVMGVLVNLVPLRFKSKLSKTFADTVKEARRTAYGALGKSRLPFNVLLDNLNVDRSSTHFPLFQVFMDYRPGIQETLTVGETEIERVDWSYGKNAYDINLEIMENSRGDAFVTINAQEYLYGQAQMDTLLKIYMHLLEVFSRNPAVRLDEPALFDASDITEAVELGRGRLHVLHDLIHVNDAIGPYMSSDWPSTLVQRVQDVAVLNAGETALKDGDGNSLTYEQMMQQVHKICNSLVKAEVQQGARVALFQQPTCTAICSLLAVMHVGAVYVPLDLRSPMPRLQAIVQDCEPEVILTHEPTARYAVFDNDKAQMINVSDLYQEDTTPIASSADPQQPAVILYTSGSTGSPKGVILHHEGIRNVVEGISKQYELGSQTCLQQSALTFDLSLNQIFVALANGGTVCVVPQAKRGDAAAITKMVADENVSYTLVTPSEYSFWLRFGTENLKRALDWKLAFSLGEELKPRLREEFRLLEKPGLRLINTYGPAEITIMSHAVEIPYMEDPSQIVPVGRSLPNCNVYILDKTLKALPIDMPGEVCVGGAGVALGYLKQKELTESRFLTDNLAPAAWKNKGWSRMYRTGDMGRLTADGTLLFEGRMDDDIQIKLRGIRIELGEIENAIMRAARSNLDEVIVSIRGDPQFLIAHAVFSQESQIQEHEDYLRQVLLELPLPQYMHPAMMIALDRMPLTSHHKIDRKAIAAIPLPSESEHEASSRAFKPIEAELLRIWESVLSKEIISSVPIAVTTSFFEVGGSSLLLIPLQSLINENYSVSLAMIDFADAHTLEKMAAKIEMTARADLIDWDLETSITDISIADLPDNPPAVLSNPPGLTILYTGSTGHSAKFILRALIADPRIARIYCVAVREKDGQPSPRRTAVSSPKITIFPGDLCAPNLGLSSTDFAHLTSSVDAILHSAANRSLWDNYSVVKRANVTATKTLLGIAIPRRVPFHFMSSSAVHAFDNSLKPDMYPETCAVVPPPRDGTDGYVASKWAIEKILENVARRHRVPVYLHRPAPVGPEPRISQEEVFTEFLRVVRVLKLHVGDESIKGHIDLIVLKDLARKLDEALVGSVTASATTRGANDNTVGKAEGDEGELVRYIHHHSDIRIQMGTWRAFMDSHQNDPGEDIGRYRTEHAVEWVGKAKDVGFPFMLAAQDFDMSGVMSALPIIQRR